MSVRSQRGKNEKETQVISYNFSIGYVQFYYPIAFDITMHKKETNMLKKHLLSSFVKLMAKIKSTTEDLQLILAKFQYLISYLLEEMLFFRIIVIKQIISIK